MANSSCTWSILCYDVFSAQEEYAARCHVRLQAGSEKMRRRNQWPVLLGLLLIGAVLFSTVYRYRDILKRAGVDEAENWNVYNRHFAMIVNDEDAAFWRDVYNYAQEEANLNDAYVELKGFERFSSDYTLRDLMDIAAASEVDGIIVQNMRERGLEDKIAAAAAAGIPVVTVLNDAPLTDRVCFVGINPYSVGQKYSAALLEMIPDGEEPVRICVLLTDDAVDGNEYQIYTQINTDLVTNAKTSGRVSVEAVRIPTDAPFASEEAIRNLFQNGTDTGAGVQPPDYIICFSSLLTDSVYQTVLDFNLAGQTQIIGYYTSVTTRNAIQNGNVSMTMVADTEMMGRACARALLDQIEEGRTNSYYEIDMDFITAEDIEEDR